MRESVSAVATSKDVSDLLQKYKSVDQEEEDEDNTYEDTDTKEYFVDSTKFSFFMGFIICVNAISIGVEIDHGNMDAPPSERPVWFAFENIFVGVFTFELILRLWYHRLAYFKDTWNVFDFALIVIGILDTWILTAIGANANLRMFTTLRVMRLLRLARLIRLLRMFKELWLIVNGLIDSLKTLAWVSLLLILLLYVSAIFTTIQIGQNDAYIDYRVLSGGWDHEQYFGSVFKSMYTLFQILTLDNWSDGIARHVISNDPYMVIFFILFIMVTTYGLLNLVVGVIVENTLTTARHNEQRLHRKQEKERERVLAHLKEIFTMADSDESGSITIEEFRSAIRMPEVETKLKMIELPIADAEELFGVLDHDGSGELSVDEFINGCIRMKGPAKSKDLLAVQISVESLAQRLDGLEVQLTNSERRVNGLGLRVKKMLKDAVEFFGSDEAEPVGPLAAGQPITPSRRAAESSSTMRLQKTSSVIPPFPESLERN